MSVNPCPACRCLNAPQAERCEACGAELGAWDTLPPPVVTFTKIEAGGALWLDDVRPPVAAQGPVDDPIDASISLTLREIESAPVPAAVSEPPADQLSIAGADMLPASGVDAPASGAPASATALDSTLDTPPPADDTALRAERKAAKRAQVRRARLRGAAAANEPSPEPPEVLVLAVDDASREHLCALLRAFGFGVHAVATQALQTASRPIVAVFVDIAIDLSGGGDGIDMCQQIRDADRRRSSQAPLLVLVAGRLRTVDQVRANLAGCDDILVKPVTRGSVASVLDARGITLPSDARQL